MGILPKFMRLAVFSALLAGCEDELQVPAPAADEPADEDTSAPPASKPGDASVGPATDGKVAPQTDAATDLPPVALADSGPLPADANVPSVVDASDAEVTTPGEPYEEPYFPPWESTTAPQDEAQTVCVDGKLDQAVECPLQACFPALQRFTRHDDVSTSRSYYSGPDRKLGSLQTNNEGMSLELSFLRPIYATSSQAELLEALVSQEQLGVDTRASDMSPVHDLINIRKQDVQELRLDGGRLRFKALGQLLLREQIVMAVVPSLCGGEHSFQLCKLHYCDYVRVDPSRALGWYQVDIDLPLVLEPLPINTP